jgi:hypothetical protein
VIDGLDVNGQIRVEAANVTIRNSLVRGAIVNANDHPGLVVDHVEVDVSGVPIGGQPQKYAVQSFWDTTIRNLKAHGMSQGYAFSGRVSIVDSYIYGIRTEGDHSEAILSNGDPTAEAGSAVIARNWLDADNAGGNAISGALCMYGDYGQIKNITVDGNHLTGVGYLLYPGAVSGKPYPLPYNVTVTNNTFDPQGFGPVYPSRLDATSTANWTNNRLISGALVPAPTGTA